MGGPSKGNAAETGVELPGESILMKVPTENYNAYNAFTFSINLLTSQRGCGGQGGQVDQGGQGGQGGQVDQVDCKVGVIKMEGQPYLADLTIAQLQGGRAGQGCGVGHDQKCREDGWDCQVGQCPMDTGQGYQVSQGVQWGNG